MQKKCLRTVAGAFKATVLEAKTNINPIDVHLDLQQAFRTKKGEDQGMGRCGRPLITFGPVVVSLPRS